MEYLIVENNYKKLKYITETYIYNLNDDNKKHRKTYTASTVLKPIMKPDETNIRNCETSQKAGLQGVSSLFAIVSGGSLIHTGRCGRLGGTGENRCR